MVSIDVWGRGWSLLSGMEGVGIGLIEGEVAYEGSE